LGNISAIDPTYACCPSVPGATATATVLQLPLYSILHKALPVTCQTEIAPPPIGLWKMTLTESWTAASDRSAGSWTVTQWLAADGRLARGGGPGGPGPVPYTN
jgi:hypothetical protein